EDRVIEEIDHRSRAERHDDLAKADFAFGGTVATLAPLLPGRHQFLPPKRRPTSHRCEVFSTSRIEVGAANRASGLPLGGESSLRTWKSRGLPPVLSRS